MKRHLLLAVCLLLIHPSTFAGRYNSVMSIGDPLPEFEALPSTSGAEVSKSQITEEVVVIVSLANHCPWVRGMDPGLVALAESFQGQPVRFIGLSVNHREDDRLPAMREHAAKNGYAFDYLFDESQNLGRALGATRTPEYFVFDQDRRLVYTGLLHDSPAKQDRDGERRHINGEPTQFYVRDAIAATLAGQPVSPAETRAHGCSVKYVQHDET